ncbi:chromosome segregation protein SMC [Youxingia wuxianensis]|uniref:chromosome segregation protein SMC n=1 Tax=Youxingia wuxianensis TaxID=2763678 RepID=UPI0021CD0541|nr:chromosome segregation protein SMC [Youxingia wuxianensis]
MRLRSLEIQGFKSFPDRTRLTFNDGITAVVGPNGSGKSNIADAVRWVLGEQSTKTLRGGKMEDVIFGGTQARKAQGYSHVMLSIDNSDRALPYENDEVTISRKLYRSGESEYRINNVNVRLKDVYELFMDTGLGKDGYSIIGQGKIAEIVSAKSTQRREIFEEAAGISKYRYRKAEAQRKLEAAEENLLRLKDILLELEGRVEPLRIQSEKAQKFLEYAGEKKALEISLWVLTLDRSKDLLRQQEDKILLCKTQHEDIQKELDQLENNINVLYTTMQTLAVEMDERRNKMKEIDEIISQNNADIAVMKNDITHNQTSLERIIQELEQSDMSGVDLDTKIAACEEEIAQKELSLEDYREQHLDIQAKITEYTALQSQCQTQIDALKERRYGLSQSINETKLSSASSNSLIDETITRLGVLKDNALIKDETIAQIEKERKDCEELIEEIEENILSLTNSRKGYQLKLESRQEKIDKLSLKRRELEDHMRQRQQKAKLLFDMENSMEGFSGSVKYIMSQASKGALPKVYGPVSKLITVDKKYSLSIEIALGAAMQNIVVEDESIAKRAIGMLKESRSGRATFLPVSTVKGNKLSEPSLDACEGFLGVACDLVSCDSRYNGVIQQLLGRVVIVEDLDRAVTIAKKFSHRFRVVTLDGQVVNAGGSMTGGYSPKSAGILSRSKDIEALQEQAKGFQEQISKLDEELKAAQQELGSVQATVSGIIGELTTAQEDKIRYDAQLRQLKAAYEDAVKTKEQAVLEYDQLSQRLESLKEKNVTNDELMEELNRQLEEVQKQLSQLGEKKEEYAHAGAQTSTRLAEHNIEIITLTKEIDGIRQMAAQLSDQKMGQAEHMEALNSQRLELTALNQQITEKIETMILQQDTYSLQIKALEEEISQMSAQRTQCEQETTQLRAQEKEITSRREVSARELARLEEKKVSLQSEYDNIISRLWDEYEITRSQAIELAQPVEDVSKAQRRLGELKSKIKSLGSVNVSALEEYKEVSERYLFLKEQVEDIEKSRLELNNLIRELTGDMQKIFAENFKKISYHFSKIFVELFDGGKAELTLTDPENILDSGIEIYVQPPGKIIKNLAALSGGEQAFVAIAIYFAILKVRPSPFCLLDEIEAALDDVNVVKYAQYLRRMCDKTQFICITHRRGTMEEADILYGVTMQEEGVSKLLELDVSEIESKLGMKQNS